MTILKDPPGPGEGRLREGAAIGTRRTRRHGGHGGHGGFDGERVGCNSEAYCTNEKDVMPDVIWLRSSRLSATPTNRQWRGTRGEGRGKAGVVASRRAWSRQRHVPSSIVARAPLLQYRGRKRRGMPGNPIEARPQRRSSSLAPRPSPLYVRWQPTPATPRRPSSPLPLLPSGPGGVHG